ncbi:hypothetical protein KAZ66_06010 [Candidatus Woesebacteria bacterium]|nr:hypothetical protein [Candidatus Woesebacteria bacterium]
MPSNALTPYVEIRVLKGDADVPLTEVDEVDLKYTEYLVPSSKPGHFLIIRDTRIGPLTGKYVVGTMHIAADGKGQRQDFWVFIDIDIL